MIHIIDCTRSAYYVSNACVSLRGAKRSRAARKQRSGSVNEPSEESLIRRLFQIEGMRRGSRRMHADLRAVPVPRDSPRPGDLDRPGLRAGGERLRL